MIATNSIMGLHLRYRLWIAELNHDINILRIFDDYLQEIQNKMVEPEINKTVTDFKTRFISDRKEIDDLRHIMHLHKMKLAAESKIGARITNEELENDHHIESEHRYREFRVGFDKLKNEFISFVYKCLH